MKWHGGFDTAASRRQQAGWLLVMAFAVLALVVDKVASTVFAVLFLAGVWLLLRGRAETAERAARWVLVAFAAYFLVGVLSFVSGEQTRLGEKLLGRDIRFLGAVAVYFAIAALHPPRDVLRYAFNLAGLVTGAAALAEVLLAADPDYRAGGRTISIVFGHLAAGLFAINVALALFERRGRVAGAFAALFALVAVILSGTRGALISVVAVVTLAALFAVLWRTRQVRKRTLALMVLLFGGLTLLMSPWIIPRIDEGVSQYAAYRDTLSVPATDAPRGCLADAAPLAVLLAHSTFPAALDARIVVLQEPLAASCDGRAALELANGSRQTVAWTSPYRSVPEGAPGQLIVRGDGSITLDGGKQPVRIQAGDGAQVVDLPPVRQLDRTRFRIHLPPGGRMTWVPVERLPGEYAFAGADSSIGNRLDMWAATWRQFDYSLLGQGTGTWPHAMAREAEAGRAAWRLAAYDHAHSDYMTVFLERGWLGLAALLAVLAAPFAWSMRRPFEGFTAALCLFVASIAVSALTETVFNHSIGITYYCVLVLLLMAASQPQHSGKGS